MKRLRLVTVLNRLRAECDRVGIQRYAQRCGVTEQYMYQILAMKRPPTETVLAPLGIQRETIYVEVGT
jgi:hypothetical protein